MLNLKLTIFELTEDQGKAEEMELDINLEDCELLEMTFHSIDYIKPAGQYCVISSGGDLFTVNESADSVNAKIDERNTFKLN